MNTEQEILIKPLESTEKTITIENLYEDHIKQLRFDLSIQRGKAWTEKQKSLFIHSILFSYPFPEIYAQNKNGYWFILDGKQRLSCVFDYMKNKYKLMKDMPLVYGKNISELYFEELPDVLQRKLKSTVFRIVFFENMTIEQRDEMFFRLNNGTALTAFEKNRSRYSQLLPDIEYLSKLPFFNEIIPFSTQSKNRLKDQELIYSLSLLIDKGKDHKGLGNAQISEYIEELKEHNKGINKDTIEIIAHYLEEVFVHFNKSERNKVLKKKDIIPIFIVAKRCVDDGMEAVEYSEFIKYFYNSLNNDSEYALTKTRSNSKEQINKRISIFDESLQNWLIKKAVERE